MDIMFWFLVLLFLFQIVCCFIMGFRRKSDGYSFLAGFTEGFFEGVISVFDVDRKSRKK